MISKLKWMVLVLPIAACVPEDYPVWATDQVKRQELFITCLDKAGTVGSMSYAAGDGDQGVGDIVRACKDVAYYQSMYCVKNCTGYTGKPWERDE